MTKLLIDTIASVYILQMFVTLLRFPTKEIMFRPIPLIIDIDIYSYFCPSKTNIEWKLSFLAFNEQLPCKSK